MSPNPSKSGGRSHESPASSLNERAQDALSDNDDVPGVKKYRKLNTIKEMLSRDEVGTSQVKKDIEDWDDEKRQSTSKKDAGKHTEVFDELMDENPEKSSETSKGAESGDDEDVTGVKCKRLGCHKDRSLMIFAKDNCFRKGCSGIVGSKYFDNIIILAILGNSITLALIDYKDTESKTAWNQNLNIVGDIFTWLFTLESLLKIISNGLFFQEKSYLKDFGNILDFVIVIAGLLEFVQTKMTTADQ